MYFRWPIKSISLFISLVLFGSIATPLRAPEGFTRSKPTLVKIHYLSSTHPNAPIALPVIRRLGPNPIQLENQQPGSSGWQLGPKIADDVHQQIKGYASAVSVNKGQSITFYVTVTPAQTYAIDIYRVGWYGGLGGRFLDHIGPLKGAPQAGCPVAPATGLIECRWSAPQAATLTVPLTWTSGIYLAHLINAQHYESYIIFVVRDDSQPADFLYQQPVATYQAYNNYPADSINGKSLYPFNSYGLITAVGTQQAVKVSFDRPYAGNGDGGFSNPQSYENYFVRWIERMGYNVTYATDLDVHENGVLIQNYRALLVGGHSEYWSRAMYDAASKARDHGVNLAFFGANDVYWQVRFEASTLGVPDRVMVCYKSAVNYDPAPPAQKTTNWRIVGQPEQSLLGVEYGLNNSTAHTSPYIVSDSASWVYKGTGFKNGSRVPGIVGNEIDYQDPHDPLPPHLTYDLLSTSPFIANKNLRGNAASVIYQALSHAWVFDAGTLAWSWALGRTGYVNVGIQKATKNILDRFMNAPQVLPIAVVLMKAPLHKH